MKLYDVPRHTRIRVTNKESPPPEGLSVENGQELMFNHIDGMYSYCVDDHCNVVHLPAWTEVDIV